MVYDLFYIFDELDLLEIRLNMYDKLVDKFVIIDATTTFAGVPHKPILPDHKERFAKWWDKIIFYVVDADDFPKDKELYKMTLKNSNIGWGQRYWIREFYIKESAKKALVGLDDEDIVFLNDIDEFWNPEKFKELTDFSKSDLIRPKQKAIYYYLNNRCDEENGWSGTIVCKYKTLKDGCLNDIRTRSKTKFIEIEDGGWHFGFLVGLDGHNFKNKMMDRPHPAYKHWVGTFEDRVKNNIDYRGRNYKYWIDNENLPKYILDNKEKWKKLFK
jgi:beta-1,4-mannosyl-glycoprotein beta-1,4-N-acetylglucosaminyltransferase